MNTQDSIKFNCQVMAEQGKTVETIHTKVDGVEYVVTIQTVAKMNSIKEMRG